MLFQDNQLFNQMRKYIGHNVSVEDSGNEMSMISLETNETILIAKEDEDAEMYNHMKQFEGDEVECVIYGEINISFESMDKFEVIFDYEEVQE